MSADHAALDPIVGPEVLRTRSDIVVADVRWYLDRRPGRAAYQEGHIPRAIYVDLDEHLAFLPMKSQGRHPIPTPASFATSLGSLGIGPDDTVVAYDDQHGMSAGRLVWMLRITGHDAALLDGGLQGWPFELATGEERRRSVFHPIRPWPDQLLVDADTAGAAGGDPHVVLVDARAPERYRGDTEPVDPKAGHIPGAVNLPFGGNIGPDGRFLDPADLRARFASAGITSADDAIVYCGSGVSACNNLLAMEQAGLGRARLYGGSWSQWSNDPDRPVATG